MHFDRLLSNVRLEPVHVQSTVRIGDKRPQKGVHNRPLTRRVLGKEIWPKVLVEHLALYTPACSVTCKSPIPYIDARTIESDQSYRESYGR